MPMVPLVLKSKMKQTIYNGLKQQFSSAAAKGSGFPAVADEFWLKLADAISGIATDIVTEIVTNAEVSPGIPVVTAGSPSAQAGATTAPGKIL